MATVGDIVLAWRKGRGASRVPVGVLRRDASGRVSFEYTISTEEAAAIRFLPYAEFPRFGTRYTENVLDIFAQRLTKPERPDIAAYYDFWEIPEAHRADKYYLLAHTQGLLATDNFEFLARFKLSPGESFISEICGLSHTRPRPDAVHVGEELSWKRNPLNEHDANAVEIFKDGERLGNLKLIHCDVFGAEGAESLKIRVKNVCRNGHLNRAFVRIERADNG